jgi:hypothetical protein
MWLRNIIVLLLSEGHHSRVNPKDSDYLKIFVQNHRVRESLHVYLFLNRQIPLIVVHGLALNTDVKS